MEEAGGESKVEWNGELRVLIFPVAYQMNLLVENWRCKWLKMIFLISRSVLMFRHFFIYVDESGGTLHDPKHQFFVLAASVIRADHCLAIQEKVAELKHRYFPGIQPHDIEIKGQYIEQAKKLFVNIRPEITHKLVQELLGIFYEFEISLFATVVSKEEESIRRLNLFRDDLYYYAYKNLINRLDGFLETENEYGILLVDSRGPMKSAAQDNRLIRFHQKCLDGLAESGRQTRIVEYPIFVQSEFFAATQLTDLFAYYIARALLIYYGEPYKQNLQAGKTTFMPTIDHTLFQNSDFLNGLFSMPAVNFPIIAKLLERSGGIEKLP